MFNQFNGQIGSFVRSSNAELNEFLGGGLHKGMVTQLFGEAGSGKTQVAMLFALGVHLGIVRPSQGVS